MTGHAKCHDCKQLFALGEMHLIKANNLSGRAYLCDPCHVAEVESIRTFNISLHKDRAMTEPSKQARDLAEEARYGSPDAAARLIDAALAMAVAELRAALDRVRALADEWSAAPYTKNVGYDEGRGDQLDVCEQQLRAALDDPSERGESWADNTPYKYGRKWGEPE